MIIMMYQRPDLPTDFTPVQRCSCRLSSWATDTPIASTHIGSTKPGTETQQKDVYRICQNHGPWEKSTLWEHCHLVVAGCRTANCTEAKCSGHYLSIVQLSLKATATSLSGPNIFGTEAVCERTSRYLKHGDPTDVSPGIGHPWPV